jgi:hypothetical protein
MSKEGTKRVEFHQAQITVVVRIVDDERSYGLQQFSTTLFLNKDAEWTDARKRIDEALEEMAQQVNTNGDGD